MDEQTQGTDPASAATIPAPEAAPEGAQPEAGGAASAPAATDPGVKSENDNPFQKRINELTRDFRDTQADRDYWRNEAARLRNAVQQTPPAPKEPEAAPTKTLEDFEYDQGKFTAYLLQEAETRAAAAAERKLKEQADRDAAERRKGEFWNRAEKYSEAEAKDFHDVVRNSRLTSPEMAELSQVIVGREEGPALAYHLAKNPQIADSLARMSPMDAAVELGRIEAKLVSAREAARKATPKVSEAPPPAPKIEGADPGTPNVKPDSPDSDTALSDAEWTRRRNLQLARRKAS